MLAWNLLNSLELPAGFRINARKVIIVQHVLLMHARGLQGTNITQKGLRENLLKSLELPSAFRINAWKVILLLNAVRGLQKHWRNCCSNLSYHLRGPKGHHVSICNDELSNFRSPFFICSQFTNVSCFKPSIIHTSCLNSVNKSWKLCTIGYTWALVFKSYNWTKAKFD